MGFAVKGDRNMGARTAKNKLPTARRAFAQAAALPPPYQLAIEDTPFQMMVLEDQVPRDYDRDCALIPPIWFSVTLTASTRKRYLYLVQQETDTGIAVLIMLFDRNAGAGATASTIATAGDSDGLRLPPSGGWLRAVVDGTVYVLASDLALSRKAITAWIGGHEPPTTPARPPYI
jgi:hypothetical protein